MKFKAKFYLWTWLFGLFCLLPVTLQSQEVVTTSGGYGETTGAKVTWTIGEPVTETLTGTSVILTQGFNQGNLIITVIKNSELPGLIIKVYPNPTYEYLKLSIGDSKTDNLNYMLIDMEGKVLDKNSIKGPYFEIPFMNLAPSIYILKIYQNKTETAIFKIIKK